MAKIKEQHISGIIPLDQAYQHFGMPWHDCFMPIGENWTMIEKSVMECAAVGCRTIWIVCPRQMEKLLLHRIGRSVVKIDKDLKKHLHDPDFKFQEIPIFYLGTQTKFEGKRNSIAWSILTGCEYSRKISATYSDHTKVDRFWISFPYGVYNSWLFRKKYDMFVGEKPPRVCYKGKSICDGKYYGFGMDWRHVKKAKFNFYEKATGLEQEVFTDKVTGAFETRLLPVSRQYSGRWLRLRDVFYNIYDDGEVNDINVSWAFELSNWKNLRYFLGTGPGKTLRRPKWDFFRQREDWGFRDIEGYWEKNIDGK